MKIIKASAGSGKTYTLSHTYLDFLLKSDDPFAYRHLLAVTFTNKATAEMKERILNDLAAAAGGDGPEAARARHYLVNILHDYGSFGVSTIDRFFQQTLRSFARELGQFSSYQVELDKDSLVTEAMDRVLDGVSEDKKDLINWLRLNAMDQIRQSGRLRLDEGLEETGARLRSEEYQRLKESMDIDEQRDYSKQRLAGIKKLCARIMGDFEKEAAALGIKPEKGRRIKYPTTKKALADPAVADFFEKKYPVYATAVIVDRQLYGLGVAREFDAEFDALLKEKNVMPLDESNALLKKIIDGSDAPFVYEKTGTRYAHYLLDEFQDTSRLQWDNFLPLLRDADGAGENLIVGDVKQSIYRWRDSDWRLLGSEVQKAFPRATVTVKEENWRSTSAVVNVNGKFFEYASEAVGLQDMYEKVRQHVCAKDAQKGCVRVSFTSDQIAAVLDSIADVRSRGARLGDIAILVRGRADGAAIADALRLADVSFISDDTLDLKGAVTVRRLVSLLSFYDDPSNTVGSFLAQSVGIEFPDHYHSLVDFCEYLLRELRPYDPAAFDAETLFIGAFMDMLQDWVSVNGNNVKAFIRQWQEKKDCYIGSPASSDAVRIMTVHKSKGLEFPHVIFPFADKVVLFKSVTRWCALNGGGTALGHEADGIYPVELSGSSLRTLFASAYEQERSMQIVDNLNIFYVAMTRAAKSLHVIAKTPAVAKVKALKAGKAIEWSNFSEMLYAWCGCSEEWMDGVPYDFSIMEREDKGSGEAFPAAYESIPLGGRLKASQDASDFFGDDGEVGPAASGRLKGIELHAILSSVDSADDLPAGMNGEDAAMLRERIEAHPEWFGPGLRSRNELTVFGSDGTRHRPDRVVEGADGGIIIIDYKFGAGRDSYLWQVRRYMNLWRRMGFSDVRGYVWYVPGDKVVEVANEA
ncbi:MAG: UvrD-helicase domain-containing protein [Bacteroidales bacterium]|nr:UvrD-helicase domain-containing protein [Bacteroidales bacterium]